jgi:glyoxylase-like metal-dependent hydrolase (beta-lactamase superfamily II)
MAEPSQQFGPVTVYFGEKRGKYPDGNQVVVRGKDALAIFDTPLVANRLGAALSAADLVVMGHAHEDHMAGLHLLPQAAVFAPVQDVLAVRGWDGLAKHYGYGAAVLAAMKVKVERDFFYRPRPDAMGYADGQVWELGGVRVRAIHMPGHTGGHSVLLVEPEGVLFLGDIDLSSFGPYYGDACSSLAEFRRTLQRVAHVPAKVWVTSHHKGVITDRAVFLDLLKAFGAKLDWRDQAILDALRAGPRTLAQLVEHRFLYPRGYQETWVDDAERFTLGQHLAAFVADGRVKEEGGDYRVA